jgi:hypothetical protein
MFDFLSFKRKKKAQTSKEIGTELEERVVDLYRRLGYFRVKRSVLVTDHFGNLSEIDVKAGIIFRRYVECKNYSLTHSVPFSDVAKFKSVLELNDIPLEKSVSNSRGKISFPKIQFSPKKYIFARSRIFRMF